MTHKKTSVGMDEDVTSGLSSVRSSINDGAGSMSGDRTRGYTPGGTSSGRKSKPSSAGKAKRGWGKAKQ